jgi:hypothetical protein
MFNIKLKRELQQLRDEFEQYKYDQSNLPKYKEGQKLEDGTIITKVERINFPMSVYTGGTSVKPQEYTWSYKGVCKGKSVFIKASQ